MTPGSASASEAILKRPERARAAAGTRTDEGKGHALFLEHLVEIERVVERVCARAGWFANDADDFRSWVFVRLMERDAKILRRFQGRSSIRTYLTVVVSNLMRDFRNARFGKWRPSGRSVRLGPVAVELDRLINRDEMTTGQAVRALLNTDGCDATEAELRALAAKVPRRPRRTFVSTVALHQHDGGTPADHRLWKSERRAAAARIQRELDACLSTLEEEDQVILRLRYWSGLSVADVARSLGLDQKPLYGRIERCLRQLAGALAQRGVDGSEVRDVISLGAD